MIIDHDILVPGSLFIDSCAFISNVSLPPHNMPPRDRNPFESRDSVGDYYRDGVSVLSSLYDDSCSCAELCIFIHCGRGSVILES